MPRNRWPNQIGMGGRIKSESMAGCPRNAHPESNGVSKALVRTFKRDYLRINPTPDAATVLAQVDGWFEDYNEKHPHSGLKMRSPREFIRAQTLTAKVSG